MAITFHIDRRTDKKGDAPIRLSIYVAGTRLLTNTGYKIAPAKWDANRQQVRKGATNASGMTWNKINAALAKIAEHFAGYEAECLAQGTRPDTDTLRREFQSHFGKTRNSGKIDTSPRILTFFDYWDEFTREVGDANLWSKPTYEKFAALRKHLERYNPDIGFEDFSEKGMATFATFLREKEGMRNTTVIHRFAILKTFLRWATHKGYNHNIAFRTYTPRLKTTAKKVIFLEWEELMRIFNYEVPANGTEVTLRTYDGQEYLKTVHDAAAIAKTRDIFCFCCFTSLRYSDAANLKRDDIADGSLTITTVKTADTITIELNKYALAILEKYADSEDTGAFVFPHLTNQRMNIYLKELCELCGINQPVTQTYYSGNERHDETSPKYALMGTHAGRRTFICNALMLGIPAEIVMKWTGHSDYKAMKPYIDIASRAKARAMARFDDL